MNIYNACLTRKNTENVSLVDAVYRTSYNIIYCRAVRGFTVAWPPHKCVLRGEKSRHTLHSASRHTYPPATLSRSTCLRNYHRLKRPRGKGGAGVPVGCIAIPIAISIAAFVVQFKCRHVRSDRVVSYRTKTTTELSESLFTCFPFVDNPPIDYKLCLKHKSAGYGYK